MKLLCLLEKTLSQEPLLVKPAKQLSALLLHLTVSCKLLFPVHQLTGAAESSLTRYTRNLVLVLALIPTYCLTFLSMGILFPPPALSCLAPVRQILEKDRYSLAWTLLLSLEEA